MCVKFADTAELVWQFHFEHKTLRFYMLEKPDFFMKYVLKLILWFYFEKKMPLKLFCCCYKHSTTIDDKPQETLPFEDRMKNEQSDFISRGIYLF